jgi:MFS family permease
VPLGQAAAVAFGVKVAESKPLRETVHHLTGFDLSGWRIAFIALSVAGVIAAALLMLLVREPKRGAKEVKLDTHMGEAPGVSLADEKAKLLPTMRDFFGRPSLLFTALSCASAAFVAYGVLNWTVPLLQRQKHIPGDQLALWYALELAIIGSFGIWLSGALVDRLSKKGKAWYALVPAVAFLVVIPFYLGFLWAPTWQTALLILAVPVLLNTFYLAPALAVVQNSVRPSQRTVAGALLLLVLNLIGLGLGPTYVGNMSTDVFLPHLVSNFSQLHGGAAPLKADLDALKAQGLQSAMYALAPFYLVAVVFHLLAAASHRKERLHGIPSQRAFSRNVMLVKFAVGILGIAALYKFGPALSVDASSLKAGASFFTQFGITKIEWLKWIFYACFGVFVVLGVLDIFKRKPSAA